MANYAIVRDNTVENVVIWDGESDWMPPDDTSVMPTGDLPVGPGWTVEDGEFVPPPQDPIE